MTDSKHENENHETDVAIAAQTTLDAARAARIPGDGDGSDPGSDGGEQVHLIMGALEKLASATDQMAQQLSERLDVVREGFARDLEAAREALDETQRNGLERFEDVAGTAQKALEDSVDRAKDDAATQEHGLRQAIAEGLDTHLEQTGRTVQQHVGRLEDRLGARLDELDRGLREEFETGRQQLTEAIASLDQKIGERIDARAHALREHADAAQEELRDDMGSLRDGLDAITERVDRLLGAVEESRDATHQRIADSRDEIREEVQGANRSLHEAIDDSRSQSDRHFEDLGERVETAKGEVTRGQRGVVSDLAEGLGLSQTSIE